MYVLLCSLHRSSFKLLLFVVNHVPHRGRCLIFYRRGQMMFARQLYFFDEERARRS